MLYSRITPLADDFFDAEAASVESLRDAWLEQREGLAETGALAAFNERLTRRWSIETGIIERLYTLDRGTTEILVAHGLDVALVEHGATDIPTSELISILRDHQDAVNYVIDHITQARPLSLHFVRSLHALLTKSQGLVEALDQFGNIFQAPLEKGKWKSVPNNPRRPDGVVHEYCPPALVEEEMETLIALYGRMVERDMPAVTRAAWLHHRFTQIHPFQDGNGRVARALTAMVFVAENGFPIVVDRDLRSQYIQNLEKADRGEIRPLIHLFSMLEKKEIEEALSLSEDSMAIAKAKSGGSLREKLLEALKDRALARRAAITARRRAVMNIGNALFDSIVLPEVEKLAIDIDVILEEVLPGSSARTDEGDTQKQHYFKSQIVEIANREGYYCDLETFHRWVRLKIRKPGEKDEDHSEIVVSLHSLGRQFTGVLALTGFYAERVREEDRTVSTRPKRLAERSLSFSYLEAEENVTSRLIVWLEGMLNMGLAEFQKTL